MDFSKVMLPAFDFVLKWVSEKNAIERFIKLEAERQFREAVADINRPKFMTAADFVNGKPILIRINLPVGLERSAYDTIVRDAAHSAFRGLAPSIIHRVKFGYTTRGHQVKTATHGKTVEMSMRGVRWL